MGHIIFGDLKRILACFLQVRQLLTLYLQLAGECPAPVPLCSVYLPLFPLLILSYLSTLLLWISRILYANTPAGVSTSTVSPTLMTDQCLTYRGFRWRSYPLSCWPRWNLRSCNSSLFTIFYIQDLNLASDVDLVQIYLILYNDFCVLSGSSPVLRYGLRCLSAHPSLHRTQRSRTGLPALLLP